MAGPTAFPLDSFIVPPGQGAKFLGRVLGDLPTSPPAEGGPWLNDGVLTMAQPQPPSITSQPQSAIAEVTETATFSVTASYAESYQWRRNGVEIAEATASTYQTPSLTLSDDNTYYDCVVTGPGGTVASDAALLMVPDDVWYLPDPADESKQGNTYRLQGPSPIICRNNGSSWVNIDTDETIPLWWLPQGAIVHVDLENDHYYWDGVVKSKSDLTDNGDGSYILALSPGVDFSGGEQVVVFDYDADWTSAPSGHLWAMTATPNNISMRVQPSIVAPVLSMIGNYYDSSNQTITLALTSIDAESSTFPGTGRHRVLTRFKNGEQIAFQPDNGQYREPANMRVVNTIPTITRIGLGCGVAGSSGAAQARAQNATLYRFTMFNRDLSTAERVAAGRTGTAFPFHLLGDSFVTLYRPQHNIQEKIAGYIGASSDAVGGTTLAEQVVRYLGGTAKWHKSTLIIADMGYSVGMVGALLEIIPHIKSGRWIVLESAPQTSVHEIGKPGRQDFLDAMNALAEAAGDRWVPTLEPAYLEADGSPEDAAEVAKGLWPLSLKKSEVDFHPSAKGDDFMARIIKQALEERGWL